jgi:hypothetical protein
MPFKSASSGSSRNQRPIQTSLRILYWGLIGSGLYFAYLNIQPYERAVAFLSGQTVNRAFLYLISMIPIINGVASVTGKGITWILGTILWGVIQIIELLPIILYNHEDFLKEIITNADSRNHYQMKGADSHTLKMLKRLYNSLPVSVISSLERLKIITYTIDFLICVSVYTPVDSGRLSDFFWFIVAGQWNRINYTNLLLAIITLFAIEIILGLILWVGKLSYAIKSASQ